MATLGASPHPYPFGVLYGYNGCPPSPPNSPFGFPYGCIENPPPNSPIWGPHGCIGCPPISMSPPLAPQVPTIAWMGTVAQCPLGLPLLFLSLMWVTPKWDSCCPPPPNLSAPPKSECPPLCTLRARALWPGGCAASACRTCAAPPMRPPCTTGTRFTWRRRRRSRAGGHRRVSWGGGGVPHRSVLGGGGGLCGSCVCPRAQFVG